MEYWTDKNYKVDFLIDSNIVVECDEFGHGNRNRENEKKRENQIKEMGYHCIRYNPDSKDEFEIFRVIREITEKLTKSK